MSIRLLQYPARNYIGRVFSQTSKFCVPSLQEPYVVPLTINWLSYGVSSAVPNMGVTVNITGIGSQAHLLDKIASVYVDNTQSDVPIYIFFPSSEYTIPIQPRSSGWFPALTFDYTCNIYGLGFTTGQIPVTKVYFSNRAVPPITDIEFPQTRVLYKQSTTLNTGNTIYQTGFGLPALGDIFFFNQVGMSAVGNSVTLFGGPRASGRIILQSFNAIVVRANASVASAYGQVNFQGSVSGVFINFTWIDATTLPIIVGTLYGGNTNLDATETWTLRVFDALTANEVLNFQYGYTIAAD